jgi:hypothetical protein
MSGQKLVSSALLITAHKAASPGQRQHLQPPRLFIFGGHFFCGGGAFRILVFRWTRRLLATANVLTGAGGCAPSVSGHAPRTMKHFITSTFLAVLTFSSFGQSLFFDNLRGSTWTTEKFYDDSALIALRTISLTKQKDKYESNLDREIWAFSDVLTIRHYNAKGRCVSDMATYKYQADADKGLLKLFLTDKQTVTYEIGIASTGNSALLIRREK